MLSKLPRVLRWSHYAKQRWANGNGVTYEVARSDHGRAEGEEAPWRWRVSQADLAAGPEQPFSAIAGVDRTLILTGGTRVSLAVEGAARTSLELHRPFTFPADVPTLCDVDAPEPGGANGAPRDLNIMWSRACMRAPVVDVITDVLAVHWCTVPVGAEASFAVALGGPARVSHQDGALECVCDLGACGEAARFDHPGGGTGAGGDAAGSRIRVLEGKAAVFSMVPL
jgi:environmental stress-induced protein Ves